mgnify:CR=1 FL=1|jgi:hypothetical protein
MANYFTNQVYAFGTDGALRAFLGDRVGPAGEVDDWAASCNLAQLGDDPDGTSYVEVIFSSTARELDGLVAGLSLRHPELVITHAAVEPANGVAYAQVWAAGTMAGEYVVPNEFITAAESEEEIFDDLLSSVQAYEKDAVAAMTSPQPSSALKG